MVRRSDTKYLLVGKTDAPPAGGYKLLVMLPGGDGSEEFNPFVRRIPKNALGDGWLIAQAVALAGWCGRRSGSTRRPSRRRST